MLGPHIRSLMLLLTSKAPLRVVARYVLRYLTRPFVKRPHRAKQRFSEAVASKQFTEDWSDNRIPVWEEKLLFNTDPEILEIGSFEGRSTLFFLTHFPSSRVTVIDAWGIAAGDESYKKQKRFDEAERRFDYNMQDYLDRIAKHRGRSSTMLGQLHGQKYDLIYIDGSHYADDLMADAVLSWPLLKEGGFMVFDDYFWIDPQYGTAKSPCKAINLFLCLVSGEYRLEHIAHQLILRKRGPRV
jgi:predicted O-methyltransferase YrrM